MPITIVKEKKQQKRTAAVAEAVDALGELLVLKKLTRKIEKGTATPAEKRQYKKVEAKKAWGEARRLYVKASAVLESNGKSRKSISAHKAWKKRKNLYGEAGR